VIAYLDKYTIMDDFKTVDMQGTHETILFYGDDVSSFAAELFNIDTGYFENDDFSVYASDDKHSIIARNDDAFGGLNFIYASKDRSFWEGKILNKDLILKFGLTEITNEVYEIKRVEYGIPAFGKEMTELTNPLECGLNRYVSFTKGCYIGQEVIARLDAYDKISKHMVGIRSEIEIPIGGSKGDVKLLADNKECGFVTSSSISDKFGNIGLGFVKTIFLNYDKPYDIKINENLLKCRITKLPFDNELSAHR
ncbi:MAG: glycine cleavage T C-terminal barrel domain-containing protein, partial [Ignavibacteria bacterium]